MAGYQYDVFLSYRRAAEWPRFIQRTFSPKFSHWLGTELGREPRIFFGAVDTDDDWRSDVTATVASSRAMVCLWSRGYFSNDRCITELSLMLSRGQMLSRGTEKRSLIVPAVIHDCEDLPDELQQLQYFDLRRYANPWIAEGSMMDQEISEKIYELTRSAASLIEDAPPYDARWTDLSPEPFEQAIRQHYSRSPTSDAPSINVPKLA